MGWGQCDRLCLVLVCRGGYGLGGVFLLFILGSNLGGGVRSGPGAAYKDHHTFSYQEEEVLFVGTQFSNLSTAVDTSAAAACKILVLGPLNK
jgi:hypothetical protein